MAAGEGAVYRREDGLVIIDPEKAKGKREIVDSCPYGAIFWNEELSLPQKCTGCAHLLDNGAEKPRCVEACPTDAMQWGDEEDFADILPECTVFQPEYGPRVYYRNIPGRFIGGLVYDPVEKEVIIGAECTLTGKDGTKTVKTDDFGDFWFKNLPEEKFSLRIEAEGFKPLVFDELDTSNDINLGDMPMERA
jgi:NAD-dependent dihydropyrimidine dehydrogenase PreA subunit